MATSAGQLSRFAFTDVSIESVSSQLRALGLFFSKNDVLGFDCKLLSMCSDLIAPIITKFANASIHSKCFASDWKLSRVTPIYKGKGDANDKGKYRPINVIGHIATIIEHEITNQVVTYLESNKLLTTDQSAYIILPMAYIPLFARSTYVNVLTPSIILYYVRKWTSMVFMKMPMTYSGSICLIENKLLNVTMTYLKCVISTLVFRKDLF